jgi:hypothetical protein
MSNQELHGEELSAVLRRVERLESQNAWLKKAMAVAVLGVVAVLAMGQKSEEGKEVVAQSFVLKDANGVMRGRWGTKGRDVLLTLFDNKERIRAELVAAEEGAFFTLSDLSNRPRLMMGVQQRNGLDDASLGLCDKDGKSLIGLTVQPEYSGLKLSDPRGNPAAALLITPHGNSLVLGRANGSVAAQLGIAKDVPALLMYEEDGSVRWRTP